MKPALGLTSKITLQPQRRISRNTSIAINDFAQTRIRNAQGKRQRTDTYAHGLDVVLQQDFARVDRTHAILKHDALHCFQINKPLPQLMRVVNQHVIGATRSPLEYQTPLYRKSVV